MSAPDTNCPRDDIDCNQYILTASGTEIAIRITRQTLIGIVFMFGRIKVELNSGSSISDLCGASM